MHRYHSSTRSRPDRHPSDTSARLPRCVASLAEQSASSHTSCHKELKNRNSVNPESTPPCVPSGRDCPVCLQTAVFPVQTNCGHLFCAPCLIAYWRHGSWLAAISCPMCRQKVSFMCNLFNESRSDRQTKEVLGEITDYNKRYSGAPRRVIEYLRDAPLLLQLLVRGLGTIGGLVWLFVFRVALCCVGAMMSMSSPCLEPLTSTEKPLETDPSLCGLLGVLDDLVVVILLLMCVINVNQEMAPERGRRQASSGGVLGGSA